MKSKRFDQGMKIRVYSAKGRRDGLTDEGQAKRLEDIMPLLEHGIEVGAYDTEVLCTLEGSKAAGDFLLHLGHADGRLAQIVGERHAQIRHKPQHLGGMFVQPVDQIERNRLLDPAPALVVPGGSRGGCGRGLYSGSFHSRGKCAVCDARSGPLCPADAPPHSVCWPA